MICGFGLLIKQEISWEVRMIPYGLLDYLSELAKTTVACLG